MAMSKLCWFYITMYLILVITMMAITGCVGQEQIDLLDARTAEVIYELDQLQASQGGELTGAQEEIRKVAVALSEDVAEVKEVVEQGKGALATGIDIAAIFSGPYAPIVTGVAALLGIGGISQGVKKTKDLNSLAGTLSRVAGDDGVINTNDELTRAKLNTMRPGATRAIRKAQGKAS